MTIFTRAKISRILQDKTNSGEIRGFQLADNYLRITKSKRTGFTFKIDNFTDNVLIKILQKKTPHPSIQNIETFYTNQIEIFTI